MKNYLDNINKMSNLVNNGNFSSPSLSSNNYVYHNTFTTDQSKSFVWTAINDGLLCLINGTSPFGYPDPATLTISTTQYASI